MINPKTMFLHPLSFNGMDSQYYVFTMPLESILSPTTQILHSDISRKFWIVNTNLIIFL